MIHYSKHAVQKMQQRGISKNVIAQVILHGQRFPKENNKIRSIFTLANSEIHVVWALEGEDLTIVTAFVRGDMDIEAKR